MANSEPALIGLFVIAIALLTALASSVGRHRCWKVFKSEYKIRYIRQQDLFSCAPIAIINALKWAGNKHATYKSLPYMRKLCKTVWRDYDSDWEGTTSDNFSMALIRASRKHFNARWIAQPDYETVRSHLAKRGAVIALYKYSEYNCHYCLFVGLSYEWVLGVNHCYEGTIRKIKMKAMRKLLRIGTVRAKLYPEVWLLTKPEGK